MAFIAEPQYAISSLLNLPTEILRLILTHLTQRDRKQLRLVSRVFCVITKLDISRVFLSANPTNIRIFHEIANSEQYRHQVVEIVWDDARIGTYEPAFEEDGDDEEDPEDGCPGWFARACMRNIEALEDENEKRPEHLRLTEQLATLLPLKESWEYFLELMQQQEDILFSGADIEAFGIGLVRFPALKRVVITPVAHGSLFRPLYETPMIRSFPKGFNYLIPTAWPGSWTIPADALPWTNDFEKSKWRGFCAIVRELARNYQHSVTELVIDVNQAQTGLNCHMFESSSTEYENFMTLLARPNFRRLDLALVMGDNQYEGWPSYRSGLLRKSFDIPSLEHLSLQTNLEVSVIEGNDLHVPLRTIFPVDQWRKLRHFSLSNFLVNGYDLESFLEALPPTLEVIELRSLYFLEGSWAQMLSNIRQSQTWQSRVIKPRFKVVNQEKSLQPGWAVWIDRKVDDFVYGSGDLPFGRQVDPYTWDDNSIRYGMGTLRNASHSDTELPWDDPAKLRKMHIGYGICQPDSED